MAYIGNKPLAKYATLTRQTFSTPTGTSHTLSQTVTNSDDLLLYINNVKQNPADYTASGTTLTTASLAGGTEMYCLYYGKTTETVAVPASSVGDSHMVDMAASKLTGTIADARFPATLPAASGVNLTALNGSNIASGTVADARISALTASKLTGALPAISGASLTGLPAATSVAFPATQVASADANTLDDYEEGVWTIGHTFGSGSSAIHSELGKYVKIGRMVTIWGEYRLGTASSPSGLWTITGLPFTGIQGVYFYVTLWNALGSATQSSFFAQYSGGTSFPIWEATNSTGRAADSGAYANSGDGPIVGIHFSYQI